MNNFTTTARRVCQHHLGWASLAICLSFCFAVAAEACPGCKDALVANDSQQYQIARGYFWSILFMMSMPALIAGTFGTYVYVEVRRAKRDQEPVGNSAVSGEAASKI